MVCKREKSVKRGSNPIDFFVTKWYNVSWLRF